MKVCINLDNISRPVSEPLGCYLVPVLGIFPSFDQGFHVVSFELDPQTGCSKSVILALQNSPIGLSFCIQVPKVSIFMNYIAGLVVANTPSFYQKMPTKVDWVIIGEFDIFWPSKVIFEVILPLLRQIQCSNLSKNAQIFKCSSTSRWCSIIVGVNCSKTEVQLKQNV